MPIPLNEISYTALNLHTANRNSTSLCGIGIYVIKNGEEVLLKYVLVKPKTKTFSFEKHGYFRKDDVLCAPTLKEVWPELVSYIKEQNIVFYDKDKSMKILHDSLVYCGLDMPYFRAVDICDIVCSFCDKPSYAQLASACGYSENFKNGDVYENLRLFRACIEYGANYGNNDLQKAFGVKSKAIPLSEAPPSPPKGPYIISIDPSKICPDEYNRTIDAITSFGKPADDPGIADNMSTIGNHYNSRRSQMTPEERAAEDRLIRLCCIIFVCLIFIWHFFFKK